MIFDFSQYGRILITIENHLSYKYDFELFEFLKIQLNDTYYKCVSKNNYHTKDVSKEDKFLFLSGNLLTTIKIMHKSDLILKVKENGDIEIQKCRINYIKDNKTFTIFDLYNITRIKKLEKILSKYENKEWFRKQQ